LRRRGRGSVALVDGIGALFLLILLDAVAGVMANQVGGMKAEAMDKISLENLRGEIMAGWAGMNITSHPPGADSFEVGGLFFSTVAPEKGTSQTFFISSDGGIRTFYIIKKG